MYKFFKELQEISKLGKEYKSIRELTIDVAKSGGYRRESVQLKNGKVVLKTKYGRLENGKIVPTWDDVLVAKWLCHYKDLFLSKLGPHPELSEFYTEIIQRTFTVTFNSLQLDKLVNESNINTIVYMCLSNRIGEALIKKGSDSRLESYEKSGAYNNKPSRERVNLKTAVNHMAVSLDKLIESGFQMETSCNMNDVVLSIQKELVDNELGLRLFNSILYSDQKVNTQLIDKFVKLDKLEKTKENLKELKHAWEIIKSSLYEALKHSNYDVDMYNWSINSKFKFSKEKAM